MKKAFFSIALAALTIASCSRDNDDSTPAQNQEQTNPNLKIVANLDASNASEWKYFSFSSGAIVQVADPSIDITSERMEELLVLGKEELSEQKAKTFLR